MVGITAHIDSIVPLECRALTPLGFDFNRDSLPDDMLIVKSAFIDGNCLWITVQYSGGCREHSFELYLLRPWCGTPPVPPPSLLIGHDARQDACEAIITETISFDITRLQEDDTSSVEFYLSPLNLASSYMKLFRYDY
jgi:hypothetical protein